MKKKKWDMWLVASLIMMGLYLLFMMYPLVKMLIQSVQNEETGAFTLEYFAKFFRDPTYASTLWNSFKVSICATAITMIIGVPMAYLYNVYEVKGRNFLQVMIILCSMSAPFLGAYAWVLLLGRGGIITKFFKMALGIKLPSIYGFGGILLALSTKMFPLVFMYVSGSLSRCACHPFWPLR